MTLSQNGTAYSINFQFQDNPEATISVPADDIAVNNSSEIIIIYMATIIFPNGLITSYRKKIDFHKGMSGVAEIITQEKRIIDTLLFPLKSIFKN
jgi:hypothetical protein